MAKHFRKNYRRPVRQEDLHRINDRIRVPEVRLVGENIEQGVYPIDKAKELAREQGLDLIEIVPNSKPPVCRVLDYSKFKYEQKKKQKELKAKQQKTVIKEIRFGPNTDDHDFQFKLKHAQNFLQEGSKVKAFVHFVGRQIVFKDRGYELIGRFLEEVEEFGKAEAPPKLEGKRLTIIIAPKAGKK
ncbi:translation initiation factor IF-3 [Arcticibacterium luteifluviistationis]|uniref:Translation initiation factor IF-3 n=1 Tax=Arcticibacterium luteifluviistationis TaxID=1784714 RepID=A0A2Z4GB91_9BACT|nr:translation initiation factor IF-3 [Arcticibacterium luteifluviistationis]AWV98559.1 translation initiation factor IF-3 [Arcticibacterium luteifluviistationis]